MSCDDYVDVKHDGIEKMLYLEQRITSKLVSMLRKETILKKDFKKATDRLNSILEP